MKLFSNFAHELCYMPVHFKWRQNFGSRIPDIMAERPSAKPSVLNGQFLDKMVRTCPDVCPPVSFFCLSATPLSASWLRLVEERRRCTFSESVTKNDDFEDLWKCEHTRLVSSAELCITSTLRSPGFGLTLVAETTTGVFLTAEVCSNPKGSEDGPSVPEDLGKLGAKLLLEEIYRVSDVKPFVSRFQRLAI